MKWFNVKLSDEGNEATMRRSDEAVTTTLTTQPHNLEDFPEYVRASAEVTLLRRQEDALESQLTIAVRQMHEACFNRPIGPRDCDREVNDLHQQIETLKVAIVAAEHALRSAAGEAAITVSQNMKPEHDKLRARVIAALIELRDASIEERLFRTELDRRGVLSGSVITPATVLDLEPNKLDAIIAGMDRGPSEGRF